MKKLTIAFALLLTAAAAAQAQTTPAGTPYPPGSSEIYPKKISDPVKLDEAHISNSRVRTGPREDVLTPARYKPATFKAELEVKNNAAQAIKSVEWTATLTDPTTGDVIGTYDVTSNSKIAPGKSKKLSKRLRTPYTRVATASGHSSYQPRVGNVKVEVKNITYVDGTTSTNP